MRRRQSKEQERELQINGLVRKDIFDEEEDQVAQLGSERSARAALAARNDDFPRMLDELAAAAAAEEGVGALEAASSGRALPAMSTTADFDNGDAFYEPKFRKMEVGGAAVLGSGPAMGFGGSGLPGGMGFSDLDSAYDSTFLHHRGSGFGEGGSFDAADPALIRNELRLGKSSATKQQAVDRYAPAGAVDDTDAMDDAFSELSDPLWQRAMLELGGTGGKGKERGSGGGGNATMSSSTASATSSLRAEPVAIEPVPGQKIRVAIGAAGSAADTSPAANAATGGVFVPFLLPDPYARTVRYSVLAPASAMILSKAQLLSSSSSSSSSSSAAGTRQPRLVRAINEALQAVGAHTIAFKAHKCKWKCVAYPECEELAFKVAVWRQGRVGRQGSRDASSSSSSSLENDPPLLVEFQHRCGCGFAFCSYFDRLEAELLRRGVLCDKEGSPRSATAVDAGDTKGRNATAGAAGGGSADFAEYRHDAENQLRRPLSARSLSTEGGGENDEQGVAMDIHDDDIAPILRMASCKFADVQCDGARAMCSIANGPPTVQALLAKDIAYADVEDDGDGVEMEMEEAGDGDDDEDDSARSQPRRLKRHRSKSCVGAMFEMVNSADVSVARCAVTAVATLCERGDEEGREAVLGAGATDEKSTENAFVRALLDSVLGRSPAATAPVANLRDHVFKTGKSTKTTAAAKGDVDDAASFCAETRRQALRALCALASSEGRSGEATVAALKALGSELQLNVAEIFKSVDAGADRIAGTYARQLSELVC